MIRLFHRAIKLVVVNTGMQGALYIFFYSFQAVCTVFQLFLLQQFINVLSYDRDFMAVLIWLGIYIFSFLAQSSSEYLKNIFDVKMTKILMLQLNLKLYEKLKKIRYDVYENDELYNVVTRMGNEPHEKIKSVFVSMTQTMNCFISLLGIAAIFLQISLFLSMILAVVLCFVIIFSTKGMNILNQTIRNQTVDERWAEYYKKILSEKATNLETRINNSTDYILELRKGKEKSIINALLRNLVKADAVYNISTVLVILWTILAIFISSEAMLNGNINIGIFVAAMQATIILMTSVENMAYSFSDLIQSIEGINYYYEFMDLPEEKKEHTQNIVESEYLVQFENVYFSYDNDEHYVLKDVSFNIKEGERIAIVGRNGAGKSTIIKLICGFFSPSHGKINFASNNGDRFKLNAVFQNFAKYNLSFRENIAMSDFSELFNDELLWNAARLGQCEDMISESKYGLDTLLGKTNSSGIELSGGEWQRIAVARGLIKESDLLVLDEPTASMDPIAESKLYDMFQSILVKKTCLIISHRLATAKMADRIIVLDNGGICEQGTHEQLMRNKGVYFEMYQMQASWYQEV